MFVIYKTIPEAELRALAADTIPKISKWFEKNPKRRVCKAELWYGRTHKIKRKDVASQINTIVEALIKEKA